MKQIHSALLKAQSEFGGLKKNSTNPYFKSNYADLNEVKKVIDEPLNANGLIVTQLIEFSDDGKSFLKTLLLHSSGESLESRYPLPAMADPQKFGSMITYARRYSLVSMFNLSASDDDGQEAQRGFKESKEKEKKPSPKKEVKSKAAPDNDKSQLINRIDKMTQMFMKFSVSAKDIARTYNVPEVYDLDADSVNELVGVYKDIENGNISKNDFFILNHAPQRGDK